MPIPQNRYGRHGNRGERDCYLQDNQPESLREVLGRFVAKIAAIDRWWPKFETSVDGTSGLNRLLHCLRSRVAKALFLLLQHRLVTFPQCTEGDGDRVFQEKIVDLKPFIGMDV